LAKAAAVFAHHGAKVLVVARNLDQADACAAELRAGGRQVSAFVGDVTKRSEMEEMARVAVERNGGIDILCANAGNTPLQFKTKGSSIWVPATSGPWQPRSL
jgi:3-oxoacyl-[acyl-carrier protein] reductase